MTSAGAIVERIRFPSREARLLRVPVDARPDMVVAALDLPRGRPVIVVNGGTTELPAEASEALRSAMTHVAAVATEDGATLVTGGTDAGVFALLGDALSQVGERYVCVGVAPAATTTWPGRAQDDAERVPLEAHHSHHVLVEDGGWGHETALMVGLAGALGRDGPSVAVLAGGGDVAGDEVLGHLRARRPIILIEGSGRLADQLARIVRDPQGAVGRFAEVARSPDLIERYDLDHDGAVLRALLRGRLAGR